MFGGATPQKAGHGGLVLNGTILYQIHEARYFENAVRRNGFSSLVALRP
jgi:hypothetical protein